MELHTIKQKVKTIKKKIFKHSSGEWDGLYKSKTKGSGLQFKEHRIYNYGDEIRFIDWKIYAKTNNPYIKVFEEERNVNIEYIIDLNNNLFVGFDGTFKVDAILEIYSLICLVAKKFNDSIILTIVYDKTYQFEPSSGEKAILKLIKFLEEIKLLKSNGSWNIENTATHKWDEKLINKIVLRSVKKGNPVFIFLSDLEDYKYIERFFKFKTFHSFILLSPIEHGQNFKHSIKISYNGKNSNSGKGDSLPFVMNLSKKFKIIDLSEDYIDSFMKHVL